MRDTSYVKTRYFVSTVIRFYNDVIIQNDRRTACGRDELHLRKVHGENDNGRYQRTELN